MGTHRFASVKEALKFFGLKMLGIFLAGVEVEVGSVVGPVVPVEGTVVGVVGAAVSFVPVHPETRAHRRTPATIDLAANRSPSMG
jgi:hypothetical protein